MTKVIPDISHWPQQPPLKCRPPVYFLFHVPKCAGRTIDQHLSLHASEKSYFRTRKRKGVGRLVLPRHQLEGIPPSGKINAIGGHYLGASLETAFQGRAIRRTMLLRDPVSHAVSYYNFRMSRYVAHGFSTYSFETAYRARQRNFITHFILRNFLEIPWPRLVLMSDAEKWRRVNAFLADFWFVGDYRRCNELIEAMAPDLGVPSAAVIRNRCDRSRRSDGWRPLSLSDLPVETIRRIQRENSLDQALWATWRDAGHHSREIVPAPLREAGRAVTGHELARLAYQIKRRATRRLAWPETPLAAATPALEPSPSWSRKPA